MLPDAGYYRATLNFTGPGVPTGASIVFAGVNATADPPATIGNNIATAWVAANMDDQQTADGAITTIHVKLGPDETGPSAVFSTNIPGTQNVACVPANVSALIHKTTSLGGRRGRGRMYLPLLPEANVDDSSLLLSAARTGIQTAITAFLAGLVAADIQMALEHSPSYDWAIVNGQPRRIPTGDPVPDPTLVTAASVESTVATQRRRLRR